MARMRQNRQTFTGGELSRLLDGQSNFAKYLTGCRILENFIPVPQGDAIQRGGTQFIAEIKDSAKASFPIPFERDEVQTFQIEMGERYARFFSNAPAQLTAPQTDAAISNGDFNLGLTGWDNRSTGTATIELDVKQSLIDRTTGAIIGDMTANGGLAAAFDGVQHKPWASVAAKNAGSGFAGKDYTVQGGYKIGKGIFYGPSNSDFDDVGGSQGTLVLRGSQNGSTWTTLGSSPWVGDQLNAVVEIASNDVNTIWPFVSGEVIGQSGALQVRLSQLELFSAADERALALVGAAGGVAWAEQQVAVTTLGVRHVLAFEVRGRLTDKIQLRIGITSTGQEIVRDREFRPGRHLFEFTPQNGPLFIQFRNISTRRVIIDNVKFFSNEPIEIATPYEHEDLFDTHGHVRVKWTQFRDFLYLFHEKYAIRKILFYGPWQWSLEDVDFIDGPYLDENTGTTTLQPSGTTGDVTITASAVDGINDDQGFLPNDVGRLIRIKHGTWGAARILSVSDTLTVTAEVQNGHDFSATTAVTAWRLGAWSETTGYPATGTVNESRLFTGGGIFKTPHRYDASQSLFFERFSPSAPDGTVGEGDAISRTLGAEKVQKIFWFKQIRDLIAGTLGAPFRIFATELNNELVPANTNSRRAVNQGVLDVTPIVTNNNALLYVARQGRRLMEMDYRFEQDGYRSPDMTELAPHIFPRKGKLISMDYMQQPESIVWTTNQQGQIASFSYERDEDITAWGRHPLGANADGAEAEYVSVIPGPDADQVWFIVKRTINGQTKRYWEMLRQPLEFDDPIDAGFYVDSGLSLLNNGLLLGGEDCTLTLSATSGTGVTATAGADVFQAGDVGRQIRVPYIASYQNDDPQLPRFLYARATITSFVNAREVTVDITVNFPAVGPVPAEYWFLSVVSVSGLDHLEGETITLVGDGGLLDPQTVTGGSVPLKIDGQDAKIGIVHAGYNFTARLVPTRVDAGVVNGTALIEKKRINRIFVAVLRSAVFKIGQSMDKLAPIGYKKAGIVPQGDPQPLATEILKGDINGGWDREKDVIFVQDLPFPLTLQITTLSQLLSSDAGGP